MTRIRACSDKAIIVPMSESHCLDSGLFIPGFKYEKFCVGDIFSTNHPDLPTGTRVFYKRFGVQKMKIKGAEFDVIRHEAIVAIQVNNKLSHGS
jgi:co-chaperonin GroES (HSP10)